MFSNHWLLLGDKLAGSLASQEPIIPIPEENPAAGSLLLLKESCTLISD